MNERIEIPNSIIGAVADVLGNYYYSHSKLNTLFMESGAPGDPPEGNCVQKCTSWLRRCNQDMSVNPLEILGAVIQSFMDTEFSDALGDDPGKDGQNRIRRALAKNGISYQLNGIVLRSGTSPSSRTLAEILKSGDLSAVDKEFERALSSVESDPPAGLTAASSIIEALCKTYIEDRVLQLPTKQTIMNLWKVVKSDLNLDPSSVVSNDLKQIFSGLITLIDGIGSLRTHAGSAHGRSPSTLEITSKEARLSIHAAHTLAVYVIEVWQERKK